MLKYLYSQVTTQEVPDEISLALYFHGCPVMCKGCHSPHLWKGTDDSRCTDLTPEKLISLIKEQKYLSCICFMGGEWDLEYLVFLCETLSNRDFENTLKVCLYTGQSLLHIVSNLFLYKTLIGKLSYIKVGPYEPKLGGLIYPSTNQQMFSLENGKVKENITHKFWRIGV